jgi:hypothetical protein
MADLCLSAIGGSRPLTDSRVAPKQPFKQLTIQGATSKIELNAAYLDGPPSIRFAVASSAATTAAFEVTLRRHRAVETLRRNADVAVPPRRCPSTTFYQRLKITFAVSRSIGEDVCWWIIFHLSPFCLSVTVSRLSSERRSTPSAVTALYVTKA